MDALLAEIARCTVCAGHLPHGVRPVVRAHPTARLLIIGQAPGRRVHETGIPWNDPSGNRLRDWLAVTPEVFYSHAVALVPMGFCFPGTGKGGDLPPRPECAPLWHERLLAVMPDVRLTLLLSRFAHVAYLGDAVGRTVTETVEGWRTHLPRRLPLPHPSPRNQRWFKRNPWFEADVIPALRTHVRAALD